MNYNETPDKQPSFSTFLAVLGIMLIFIIAVALLYPA